jgi:hypothetical protein
MKLVGELKKSGGKSIIVVLTGNGRTEQRVLKSLAEKYDGSEKILFLSENSDPFQAGKWSKGFKSR